MVQPKKRLGQHFLTDPAIAKRIVGALEAEEHSAVLEIGPGKGVLTTHLLEKFAGNLLAVEIDDESVAYLNKNLPGLGTNLLEGNFLELDLGTLVNGQIAVIGNFPYNISSQIFFRILEYREKVNEVVCMLQREVAQRISSPPGSKEYGILSVLLQAYYEINYLFSVKPGSFFPPPSVVSGVIRLKRNHDLDPQCDEVLFRRVVKACFNQRRKTIRNSIKSILLNLEGDHPLLGKRPEQLSVSEFAELTNWIASMPGIGGQDNEKTGQ